ncbi:MAG: DCC1-like thiol-disulfide oxidoreductase family protein [Acidobacteria bacterium]|nr:DCC1-like thiol-disulfide oxidoreductase family protein [Acidobacteriota bacterium]
MTLVADKDMPPWVDSGDAPVLLYDGVCGFCNKSVQVVIDHDRRGAMRFAALQSAYGQRMAERHPELRGTDSVVYVERADEGERVYVRSDAALKVAAYLGGPWKIFLAAKVLPRGLRDYFYDLFARNRYRLFGKYDTCLLPPPEVRARFLDV